MNKKVAATHHQYVRNIARVSIIVAVVATVGLTVYLLRRPTPAVVTVGPSTGLPPILTPQSYEDFVGPITAVSPDRLVVTMHLINQAGQPKQRAYTVTIGDATIMATSLDRASGSEIQPAEFNDFRVGDTVQVFGPQNLYPLEKFTAIKVYKFISS